MGPSLNARRVATDALMGDPDRPYWESAPLAAAQGLDTVRLMRVRLLILVAAIVGCGGETHGSGETTTITLTGGSGGGETTTAMGGGGGASGGSGGTCEAPTCGPKECGTKFDMCGGGNDVDCGTCTEQNASGPGGQFGGPMLCDPTAPTNHCVCPAEGNTAEAMALCQGDTAQAGIATWCKDHGGCNTALCGTPPVPKAPDACVFSGQYLKPDPDVPATWSPVWCCAIPCTSGVECNDGNECTQNKCVQNHCQFPIYPNQTPCSDGTGMCLSGTCVLP